MTQIQPSIKQGEGQGCLIGGMLFIDGRGIGCTGIVRFLRDGEDGHMFGDWYYSYYVVWHDGSSASLRSFGVNS
jgi:hypothetical protein